MMPLSEIFFLAIVLYLLYRFIFNFLVPVVRTTRQVRQQFRNMQENMGAGGPMDARPFEQQTRAYEQTQQHEQRKTQQRASSKPPADDYIDFEEIK